MQGFDDVMLPACMAIFYRSLDARNYDPDSKVPADEEKIRRDAKVKWTNLIHYVASQGWVEWNDVEEESSMDDSDMKEGEGEQDVEEELDLGSEDGGLELDDGASGGDQKEVDSEEDDGPDDDGINGTHRLHKLDEDITAFLPHTRYRGPVFYALNFACAVLATCVDHRRNLAPQDIDITSLSSALVRDIKDFFGPNIALILAGLLLEIMDQAQNHSNDFDTVWPTLDLDHITWIPAPDNSCVTFPFADAKGKMWTTEPEPWLMNAENLELLEKTIPKARNEEGIDQNGVDEQMQMGQSEEDRTREIQQGLRNEVEEMQVEIMDMDMPTRATRSTAKRGTIDFSEVEGAASQSNKRARQE